METTIDKAGRVVIPQAIRLAAGLEPGMRLDIRCIDGRVEIETAVSSVRIEDRDGFLVAVHDGVGAPLTAEMVEQVRQDIYLDRERQILGE